MPPFDVKAARAIRRAACASLAQQGERATAARLMANKKPCPLTADEIATEGKRLVRERTKA